MVQGQGVPLFVHAAPSGPIFGSLREAVEADLADRMFVLRFQEGLKDSLPFRNLHIQPGDYGTSGTHETIFEQVAKVDLLHAPSLLELHNDPNIRRFDFSSSEGALKHIVSMAAFCSAKMNSAFEISGREAFSPLADMSPYANLLSAKYNRVVASAAPGGAVAATDLSLAILDELLPAERVNKLTIDEAIQYRKESSSAREDFLEYLLALQVKLGQVPKDGDYSAAINKIITGDIRPAARQFHNKLDSIYEKFVGKIIGATVTTATSAVAWAGSSAGVHILGDVTWQRMVGLTAVGAAYVASKGIDALVEMRAVERDVALSYLLDLEK